MFPQRFGVAGVDCVSSGIESLGLGTAGALRLIAGPLKHFLKEVGRWLKTYGLGFRVFA